MHLRDKFTVLAAVLFTALLPCQLAAISPMFFALNQSPLPPSGLSIVQSAINENGGGTSVTVTPTSPLTAGNLAVVVVGVNNTTSTQAVADNVGSGTWTLVKLGSFPAVAIFYQKNLPSGITTITGSESGGGNGVSVTVIEISGASISTPFTNGEAANSGFAPPTVNPVTGSITNATAASIIIAALQVSNDNNTISINQTGTVGTWTAVQSFTGPGSNSISVVAQIVTTSTSQAHGWLTVASTNYDDTVIAAFH